MSKLFLKSIAVITSTLFIATNLSWANVSSLQSETKVSAQVTSIQIPEALGTIQDQHISAPGSPFVVLIQDAHAVTEAQTQIQKLIQYLGEKYGISLAALEGTSGKMDATLLRAFPDEKVKEKVLSEYLSRGEITGAEMAAVFNAHKTEFFGIEDMKLYEENYFAYLSAVKNQKSIFAALEKTKSELDSRRKSVYSSNHNEFYLQVESFRAGKTSVLDLFKYFRGFDLKKYPNLKKICDLSDKEITKKNIHQISDIKGTELFGEMEKFISETENSFCNTQEQKDILESYRRNALLHDLASLELTKEQYLMLHTPSLSATPLSRGEFPSSKRGRLEVRGVSEQRYQPALEFYRLALLRDKALHANLNQLLAKQKAKSAIVIAGGFHTEGFKEALKKSGYSYAIVQPALHSANGHENYASLMQGSLSYKQYLKSTLYDAFLKDSSIKLARALDPRDASQKMKYWRDEVIRVTALQGRVGDSGKYTRYIDSLNTKSREEILAAVRKVLDSFLAESFQKMGTAIPVSAKSSALIHLQAHPLMPSQSNRFRDFILAEKFSGKSLGMPEGVKALVDEIKKVDPVTFAQQAGKSKWDFGQAYALKLGINPSLVVPGLRLDRGGVGSKGYTKAQIAEWWRNSNNSGNDRTNRGARAMFEAKATRLSDDYRTYFIGVGPEGGDFRWFEVHQILHDMFLTGISVPDREEFLKLVLEAREEGIKKNTREQLSPEDHRYFTPHVSTKNDVFGLNHDLKENPLSNPEDTVALSEMFARLGANYLGYHYKEDRVSKTNPSKFYSYFDKIKLRASEEDLKALLTSLKASARSLGEEKRPGSGRFKVSPELFRGPPEKKHTLSTIIRDVIDFDKLVYGLTADSLKVPGVIEELEKRLENEKAIYKKIETTTTDDGKSLPVILEQAETLMFDHGQVNLGMISVPISAAAAVGKEFGLDESKELGKTEESEAFEDVLKKHVSEALVRAAHPGANFEDPDRPQNAYLGGRIVIPNVDSAWLSTNLNAVIKNVKEELKRKYEEKIVDNIEKNPDNAGISHLELSQKVMAAFTEFHKKVDGLDFHASQVLVHLKPEHDVKVKTFEIKDVEERLNEIKKEILNGRTSFDPNKAKSVKERNELFALIDDFQAAQRLHYASAARYWIDHENEPEARAKASHFLELLLEDAVKKLNERLEFIEKVTNEGLKRVIQAEMKRKKARMDVLDNESVRKIKETLVKDDEGGLRSQLFQDFYVGRQKTIPLFNRYTGRLPRLLSRLHDVYNEDDPDESLLPYLFKSFDELKNDINNSNPDVLKSRLEIFRKNYKTYRKGGEKVTPRNGRRNLRGFNEILSAAYSDPRLQRIYKLFWMDEVLEADSTGLLEEWKNHLESHRQAKLARFIEPGLFVFKRPVGDEVGFIVKEADGSYRAAFAELNKGNAYFTKYTPDGRDIVYHKILLKYLVSAIAFKRSGKAKDHPLGSLGFLEGLDDLIRKAASEPFDDIEKVKLEGKPLERMHVYEIDGMHYAKARDGKVYVQAFKPGPWLPTDEIIPEGLKPVQTTLSAARTMRSEPIIPGKDKIIAVFAELDYDNYEQKKDPKLIHQVATTDQIRRNPASTRRFKLRKKSADGKSLGGEEKKGKKSTRPVVIRPRKRLPDPDRLQLFPSGYNDLFRAILGLFKLQRRAAKKSPEGMWEGFFRIIEEGDTVEYAVYLPGQEKPYRFVGEIPRAVMAKAELILIQNIMRSTRPGVTNGKRVRLPDDHESVTKLRPDNVRKVEHQFRLEQKGIVSSLWWLMFNPFSIWPQKAGKPLEDQPHHLTISRADGIVSQKDMSRRENLLDIIKYWMDLNDSESIKAEDKFRLAVNGWYYHDASDAVKAGASQSQAHAHLVRFTFPIERVPLLPRLQIRNVEISEIADNWGSGIVLEAPRSQLVELVDVLAQTLKLITSSGNSFNFIATTSEDGKNMRVFIADRVKNGPEFFENEWGFSEFSRVVVVDNPTRFYKMDPALAEEYSKITDSKARIEWLKEKRKGGFLPEIDSTLRADVIKSLIQVTAKRMQLNDIFEGLKKENSGEIIQNWIPQEKGGSGSSLGVKVDEIYQQIKNAADITVYVSSKEFEESVTAQLGAIGTPLVGKIRAVVVPGVEVIVPPVSLSADAKFLLTHPQILAGALKNKHGIDLNLKSDYVIDASFLHQSDAVKFIQQLGTSAAVTFASGTPDADLASKLHGTRRVGYGHNNILDQKKLRSMSNPVLILPSGISFRFTEGSDWKKRGVEAEPGLVNPYETSEFVRLVEIILQTRKLKDNGVSFPVIDQEMLNSVVTLLNNLAKEEFTREAIGRAA